MKLLVAFLLLLPAHFTNTKSHPLFVSNTDATYNTSEKSVEIISKIFLDDLEKSLKTKFNTKVDLFATPTSTTNSYVLHYMQQHLQYTINGKAVAYNLIGYERKKDACWVYVEIPNVTTIKSVTVTNSILHDFSSQQINLIHFTVGSNRQSHKFTYPNKEKSFTF
jgi:intergrase/recombinase